MSKKKVLIIGSSKFSVPAVQGGAVPYLIEELIQVQCTLNKVELFCCSLWDNRAEKIAQNYKNTSFIWAKVPRYIHLLDVINTWITKNIFNKDRLQSIGFLMQVVWFTFFVAKELKKNNYDIVIFENSVPMLFSLKLYNNKIKYKGKYYIHMHSVPRKYYGNAKIFSNCKGLISISKYVANEIMKDNRVSISNNQIKLMYNCIDTEIMKPMNLPNKDMFREEYGIQKNEIVFLFAGRLCKEKGIEEVIQSIMLLEIENYKLLIVGSNFYSSGIVSSYEKYLKKLSEPIKDKIKFTGYVNYEKMPFLYNNADIVLLPSMWDEPAGMTIIEAMACRKAIITTKSGGIPEYVSNDSCVLLNRDSEIILNMKNWIMKLIKNENLRKTLESSAYERARLFNKEFYYKQFTNIVLKDESNENI